MLHKYIKHPFYIHWFFWYDHDAGYNRCKTDERPCSVNAVCVDSSPTNPVMCMCRENYEGDGYVCNGKH